VIIAAEETRAFDAKYPPKENINKNKKNEQAVFKEDDSR
jgi:hypothetical protein